MRRSQLTALLPRGAVAMLTVALGGTFAEALVPFAEPRALNYLLVVAALAALLLTRLYRKPALQPVRGPIPVPAMTVLLAASLCWLAASTLIQTGEPLRLVKLFLFLTVTLPCALLTARLLEPPELVVTLFSALFLAVAASALLAVLLPEIGAGYLAGRPVWTGIYGQKNSLGRQAAFLGVLATFVLTMRTGLLLRIAAGIALALAAVVIMEAYARTALGLLVVGCLLALLVAGMPRWAPALAGMASIIALVIIQHLSLYDLALIDRAPSGLILLGSPIDLTGRLPVWNFAWGLVRENPVMGSGFDAIWSHPGADAHYVLLGWKVTDAHNGYLDLVVQGGVVGASLFGLAFLIAVARAIRLVASPRPKTVLEALFSVAVMLFALVNLTSSHITEILSFPNFLFLVVCFAADRVARRPQPGRTHDPFQRHHSLPQPA